MQPPHNGMMNMQQPGQYINQQVKKLLCWTLSCIKCYYFSTFSHAPHFQTPQQHHIIHHLPVNPSLSPTFTRWRCARCAGSYERTQNVICGNVVGGISRHQVKPDWASDMRKHEKYKNIKKILNCRINSCQHHTSEWIKWWKVWGKLFTTFSECGKTHSFSSISSVEKRAFDGRRCSSCWTHSIHNTLCFNIHIVEFNFWLGLTLAHSLANLCQMCHVDSAQFTLKPLTFFRETFFRMHSLANLFNFILPIFDFISHTNFTISHTGKSAFTFNLFEREN